MAGHTALFGDRFSMIRGAQSSLKKGAKAQYYPCSPPESLKYNPDRPKKYDLLKLPMRTELHYRETLAKLNQAKSKTASNKVTKMSGISRMPLCMFSPAFLHPSFFPLDPFHLIYENCMAYLWDLWTTFSAPEEMCHLSTYKAETLGRLVSEAMCTLPPCFCGPIRDPFLKRQSQYKIFEWMALLHWYIIPLGTELGFNPTVLSNFAKFVEIADIAMAIRSHSPSELRVFHSLIKDFLEEYETIYVGEDPEKVSRCRLCIFQLIHIPTHIEWYGSIRLGSQATVERAIGEMGHKIRSKKAPFANMATIIWERELMRVLLLHEPSLAYVKPETKKKTFIREVAIKKSERKNQTSEFWSHLSAICKYRKHPIDTNLELCRWAKYSIPNKKTLTSKLFETLGKPVTRSSKHFEAVVDERENPVFGQALAYYEVVGTSEAYVVFIPLIDCKLHLKRWKGKWGKAIEALPVKLIQNLIGTVEFECRVHILRKHPGLHILNLDELNLGDELDVDEEGDVV
ncbi:hypothetical protein FA95DRAFT_1504300 [Auriscalpium vulgare]|uniref:Uncharacterized protein n=1 Tax=Auriscalpium vulgare TaxID=40419 RepID=A0ACB8R636_9AGAM|nr:hypothetical protein FA95DRAFT_1504300 [Auriscalpium vulgare]